MAFNRERFAVIAQTKNKSLPTQYAYHGGLGEVDAITGVTDDSDTLANIVAAGYFNPVKEHIKPGDLIFISYKGAGGQAKAGDSHGVVRVKTVPEGNVTVSAGQVLGGA